MRPANQIPLSLFRAGSAPRGKAVKPAKPKAPRRGNPPPTLDTMELLRWTDSALAAPLPPKYAWIARPEPPGRLVARFVLPLSICRNRNAATVPGWQKAKDRQAILDALKAQLRIQARWRTLALPLPGRPHIRAVRFSSVEADPSSDGAKVPIDCLCPMRERAGRTIVGLGLIAGDRGSQVTRDEHWEPAPRGKGCLLLEIWDGSEACPF